MGNQHVRETNVKQAITIFGGNHIGTDLLLVDDFRKVALPSEPRRMQCLLMGLCLDGSAQYTVDTVVHEVSPGSVILISEGQVIDNIHVNADCHSIGLILSYDFFYEIVKEVRDMSSLFLFARTHPVYPLLPDEVEQVGQYYSLIKKKVEDTSHHFQRDTVRNLMATMICDLSNALYRTQTRDVPLTRCDKIFHSFIHLVEQNFRTERRVSWYASKMCITSKYLSESVRQASDRKPGEWIDNYVTLEMRVLLKNTTLSIKEIAERLNFPNQSFFGRYFKEHVGMSPSEYRKQ